MDPLRYYGNVFFRVKLVLLALAAVNALAFHVRTYQKARRWDEDPQVTATAQLAGAVSLLLWCAIIVSGRLIAFNDSTEGADCSCCRSSNGAKAWR